MKNSINNEKANNFKRITENRVNKILQLFDQLKNLTNKSFYEYSNDDIEKIFETLEREMSDTKKILLNANSTDKKKRFVL